MTAAALTRRFVVLRALRWVPLGLTLPFIILLPQERGLGLGAIGVVWATHSVITLLLEVPSGALADAIGRRVALLAGAAASVAGLVAYALASGIVVFMAAAATIAAGRALISGSLEAWFVDALRAIDAGATLRDPLAKGAAAEALATAAAAVSGGFLPLLAFGGGPPPLALPALAGAGAGLVYLAAVAAWVHEPPRRTGAGWRAAGAEALGTAAAGLGMARTTRTVRVVIAVAAVVGMLMSGVELLWQPRLDDLLGRDPAEIAPLFGVVVAASMLAAAAGSLAGPWLARRRGARAAYTGAAATAVVGVAALAGAQSVPLFLAAFLLFYWSLGVADPLHFEFLHDAIDSRSRATVVSAESLAGQGGGLASNLLLAQLAGLAGIAVAWAAAAAVGLVAVALARTVDRSPAAVRPRRRPGAPSGAA